MFQLYGYARVSSADQDLSIQQAALKAAGCAVIRAEKASGTSRNGRSELETLMQFLRRGDTLVVTRIDRLARSMRDLQNLVHELREKGAHLKATEQPIDTGSAAGQGVPGHARRVRGVRDEPAARAPNGGHRTPQRRRASTRAALGPSTRPRSRP